MSWDTITASELFLRAATLKGIKINGNTQISEILLSCRIDEKMLNFLFENYGFGNESNSERTIITDRETEESWIFNTGKIDVSLFFSFRINTKERMVIFIPKVRGSIQYSTNEQAEAKLFMCLADGHQRIARIPAIVRGIIESHDYPTVSWKEIGLSDVVPIRELFLEFADKRKDVMELSASNVSPFIPNPNRNSEGPQENVFVFGSTQRKVLESWKRQFEEYKTQLALLI